TPSAAEAAPFDTFNGTAEAVPSRLVFCHYGTAEAVPSRWGWLREPKGNGGGQECPPHVVRRAARRIPIRSHRRFAPRSLRAGSQTVRGTERGRSR
ncbi:MAG TPA: hypothetical protein VF753_22505, partial [Terriglobales bacterium]